MSQFKVIPAIDLIGGKCVRLEKGDYATSKTYDYDPLELAKELEGQGMQYLHIVDLDGAKSGQIINYPILEAIARHTSLHIDFGGGLKRREDLQLAFDSGAQQVSIGSMAVKDPEKVQAWLEEYGSERISLSADAKEGKVAIHAWQDLSEISVVDLIKRYQAFGLTEVVCTDISKDGMLSGPGFELYAEILEKVEDISLIASGGVSKLADIYRLQREGLAGVIIGKAMYEGRISIAELGAWQNA